MSITRVQTPYRSSVAFGTAPNRPNRRDALQRMSQTGYRIFQAGLGMTILGTLCTVANEISPEGYRLRRENPRQADRKNTNLMAPGGALAAALGAAAAILAEQGQQNLVAKPQAIPSLPARKH